MKNLFIVLALSSIFLFSCSEDIRPLEHVINTTSQTIAFGEYTITSGEVLKIQDVDVSELYEAKSIENDSIQFLIEHNYSGANDKHFFIKAYIYDVTYKISGTGFARITFAKPNGDTGQIRVELPHTINYTHFDNDFTYVSAQNETYGKSITVIIYRYESNVDNDSAFGEHEIATASNLQ